MNKISKILSTLLLLSSVFFFYSCDEDDDKVGAAPEFPDIVKLKIMTQSIVMYYIGH